MDEVLTTWPPSPCLRIRGTIRLDAVQDALVVDVDEEVHILVTGFPDVAFPVPDAGVVHKHVDLPEHGFSLVGRFGESGAVGDVQQNAGYRPAVVLEDRQRRVDGLLPEIGEHDAHAFPGAGFGDPQAEPAGPARDKCSFPPLSRS